MNYKTSKGFTLIEVLVSMVILAVGVLGLGVMQLSSLQNTQSGQMRSQASILAYDILDAMRTNAPAVSNSSYSLAFDAETPKDKNCYGDKNCSSDEMAQSDLHLWRDALDQRLPTGNGQVVTTDMGDRNMVEVTVNWTDPYDPAAQNQVYVVTELPK